MNAACEQIQETAGQAGPVLLYAEKEVLDPSSWQVGEHHHEHHEILIFQRGQQCTRIHGDEMVAGPGEMFLFSKGTPHEEWLVPDAEVVKYTLGFKWDIDLSDLPHRIADGCGRLTELADWIAAEVPRHNGVTTPTLEPLLYGLVGEMRRAAQRTGHELKEKARRVVQREMKAILSVQDLAQSLGMSRSHLSRRFCEETGSSPSDFLREERLRRARFLLRNTDMAVKEVAASVGVSSEQQLCRMVKQFCGMTTRELRQLSS